MIRYCVLVNLYGALFYLLYLLFLKERNNLYLSRFFLLGSVGCAALFPLIQVSATFLNHLPVNAVPNALFVQMPIFTVSGHGRMQHFNNNLFPLLYLTIVLIRLIGILYGHYKIHRRIGTFSDRQSIDGIQVFKNTRLGPGSYMRSILFPDMELNEAILRHEMAHIRLGHTLDQLFFQIILALFFPVIPFYLMNRESGMIREFQADRKALKNKEVYIQTLIEGYGLPLQYHFIQFFFQHSLKRRIMMLSKPRKKASVAAFTVAGLLGCGLLLTFQNVQSEPHPQMISSQSDATNPNPVPAMTSPQTEQPQSKPTPQQSKAQSAQSGVVYRMVDQQAEFPNGETGLYQWLGKNIKSPDKSKADQKTGIVQIQFVIDQSGKPKSFHVLKSLSPEYDSAAIQAVRRMPNWKPAETKGEPVASNFILPISFQKN